MTCIACVTYVAFMKDKFLPAFNVLTCLATAGLMYGYKWSTVICRDYLLLKVYFGANLSPVVAV